MGGDSNIGRVLDRRYELVSRLAEGGMGVVYRARHVQTEAALAVKFLRPELCANPAFVRRLHREARCLALARHDNIVEIIDVQPEAEEPYLVTELLVGEDLSTALRREGRLSWPRVQAIMLQVCDGMQHAHDRGFIHRDLKPANCFELAHNGRIKILDFGVSRPVDRSGEKGITTAIGQIFGTSGYMPIEQCIGDDIDARADVYAAGAMMFELLTGRLPFADVSPYVFVMRLQGVAPPPLREVAEGVDVPVEAEAVVRRALAWRREDRYSSMRELAAAIRGCSEAAPHAASSGPAASIAGEASVGPEAARALVVASAGEASVGPEAPRGAETQSIPVIRVTSANTSAGRGRRALVAVSLAGATAMAWTMRQPADAAWPDDRAGHEPAAVEHTPEVGEDYCQADEPTTRSIVQCELVTRADEPASEIEPTSAGLAAAPVTNPASAGPTAAPVSPGPSHSTALARNPSAIRKERERQVKLEFEQIVRQLELSRYVSQVALAVDFSPQGKVQAVRVRHLVGTRHQAQVEAALRELTLKPFPGETLTVSQPFEFD